MSYNIPNGVFHWPATKSWATLYAEIQAAGGVGTVLVEPTAFPGLSVTAGTWDLTQIRFQGMQESNATSFGSNISFDVGAKIDAGAYVALRGDAVVFAASALLMTPSAKRVVLQLTGGTRFFRLVDTTIFDSTSAASLFALINSSISGIAVTTTPIFNLNNAAARCTVQLLNALSGINLFHNVFGGVAGSGVFAQGDNFGSRFMATDVMMAPCVWLTGSVSNRWSTAGRPLMSVGFGAGVIGVNIDTKCYDLWDGSVWRSVPSWLTTTTKTATYTASYFDTVRVDPSAGGFPVNLPTAVGLAGVQIKLKNVTSSANSVTVTPFGAETIDTSASRVMNTPFESLTLESDGSNWLVI